MVEGDVMRLEADLGGCDASLLVDVLRCLLCCRVAVFESVRFLRFVCRVC